MSLNSTFTIQHSDASMSSEAAPSVAEASTLVTEAAPSVTEPASCPDGCSVTTSTNPWNYSLIELDLNSSLTENSTSSNFTGPAQNLLSDEAQAGLIVLYSLTILFSIIGNVIVIIVFTRGRRCRTDIRPFLINLAVADLIMAVFCMPFTFTFVMIRTWIFTYPMCPIVLFMQHLSVSASVFTNMAIGIDRFLVVTFPLRARMTSKRAKYIICGIWICAVGLSSVQLAVGRAVKYGDVVDCDEQWGSSAARSTFTMFVLFITYIIPLVILAVTYSIVSILLWKRTAPGNAHEGRDLQQLRAKRKVIKMLVLVVIMFGLCWLPLHTFFLVLDFNPQLTSSTTELERKVITIVFYVVFWLAMSNSCANPIIYGFTNESFRNDMASLCYHQFPFCQCLKKLANRRLSMSTYESGYNKRFSTVRKNGANSLYKQGGYRNGSRVYIELKRDMSRGRSLANMNDFYKDSLEREKAISYINGRAGNCISQHDRHRRHHCNNHHHHHTRHNHPPFFRSVSGDSTVPLASFNNNDLDRLQLEDNNGGPISPNSPAIREFSFTKTEDSGSSCKLNPLPEAESCSDLADFNTV